MAYRPIVVDHPNVSKYFNRQWRGPFDSRDDLPCGAKCVGDRVELNKVGSIMSRTKWVIAMAIVAIAITSRAEAQSAGGPDAEIALLKQQLKLMEQKLDKLEKQTAANTTAAASANAKVDARAKADVKTVDLANTNAAYPVKDQFATSGVVVTMPNNRPTICTADSENCIAITSRIHWDVGGYVYHPNSSATSPQKLDDC
jgi:phosphate-selective porin OprO/OprP